MKFNFITMIVVLLNSITAFADRSQLAKTIPYSYVHIDKIEKNKYELVLVGSVSSKYSGVRHWQKARIPIQINVQFEKDFGGSFQVWGANDNDPFTGKLDYSNSIRVADVFTQFIGNAWNAGIVVLGFGSSKSVSASGLSFSKWNGAVSMIGPAGTPIGLHGGLSSLKFIMEIKPVNQNIILQNEISRDYKHIDSFQSEVSLSEILNQQIRQLEL